MTESGKARASSDDHLNADPAWFEMMRLRVGYPRIKLYSNMLAAAATGFLGGSLLVVPRNTQLIITAILAIVAFLLARVAQQTLDRAVDLQRQAIANMKITEIEPEKTTLASTSGKEKEPVAVIGEQADG